MATSKKTLTGKAPSTKSPKPTAAKTDKVTKSEGVTTAMRMMD